MLRGNLAADLVLNRRSRSAATRHFSFEPIRLASLPLADLGCESGICRVLLDCDQRKTDFVWAGESSWPILFSRAAIAPASKTRRNRLRSRAAGFLLSWGSFLGRKYKGGAQVRCAGEGYRQRLEVAPLGLLLLLGRHVRRAHGSCR